MANKTIPFEEVETRLLHNAETRQAFDRLEPAYQIARLRTMRGLTQQELAELVGTKQPSIARLENGKSLPNLSFLKRVAAALGAHVKIAIEPDAGSGDGGQ